MINAKVFVALDGYKRVGAMFSTCPEDRPVIAQFCSHVPEQLLEAAMKIQHCVDAVDLNFGCPQQIAKKGRYGAFLLEEPD